jgi:slime mold repeat-containing protein
MLRRSSWAVALAAVVGSGISCEGDYVFLEPDAGGIAGFSGFGLSEASPGDISENGGRGSSLFDAGPDAAIPCYVDRNCDDNDACNGIETCESGLCRAGTPVVCEDDRACITHRCEPSTGACVFGIAPDGTSCPDTDLCDGTETCFNGVCSAAGSTLGCDDGNPCTVDTCNPVAGCVHAPAADGTACPDADLCDGTELCLAGACTVSGTPVACGDGNSCTTDSCVPATGCNFAPVADGTPCADGDVCDGAETCSAGVCSGSGTPLRCNDGNPCTLDTCVATIGCLFPPVADGTACPDGNLCNGTETCAAGRCTGVGTPLVCADDNPCTNDLCVATVGCVYPRAANGTPCPNSNPCDGTETCNAGACSPGTPLVCNDDNACTRDGCNTSTGCVHTALTDGTDCPDANLCDGTETCTQGVCSATGTPLLCPAGHSCLPNSGLCN